MSNKIIATIKYLFVMALTIFVGVYAISFLVEKSKKPATCDKEHIYLCDTENVCQQQAFYWWDDSCHLTEEPQPAPSEYPDYDSLKDLTPLVIIENKISWSPEANLEKIIGYQNQLKSTGQFARIYLYAEVSIDNKPLTQYESLYVQFNNIGGHLFRPQSLKIPSDTITKLLYAVNNVPYLEHIPYSENKTPLPTDWFQFFKDGSSISFYAYISSLKPATINKIVLYYGCAEGSKGSDCKIEVNKKLKELKQKLPRATGLFV